ncbi:MAG: hypothetical protein EA400_10610 [Chromatiaceae bacterium]|nr:MAG: hypothetical protein EA400_10610 [Chromatiaceae bacterium]
MLPAPAQAGVFQLANPNDSVIGAPFYVTARKEDTLFDIGRFYGYGHDELKLANPKVDTWLPGEGTEILIPNKRILPSGPREGIVLNLAERRLYFYRSPNEVEMFAAGVGRDGWETPVGTYSIIEKRENPTWTPPESVRRDHAARGSILPAVVPPGPDNPLGAFAMRLSNPSYLIHGTNKPDAIGMPASAGCTRMFPEDIERLYQQVPVGTTVRIVDQPYKVGWQGNRLYLEVNALTDEVKSRPVERLIPTSIANAEGVFIDWDEVRRVQQENAGIPRLIGGRQGATSWHRLDAVF